MGEQLSGALALVWIFDAALVHELDEVGRPLAIVDEARRGAAGYLKERAHWIHIVERRIHFGKLDARNANRPNIYFEVVRRTARFSLREQ